MDDIDREPDLPVRQPLKRKRSSDDAAAPQTASAFRNVTACNRCRTRKHKCDLVLPACAGCVKSGTPCVGWDPVLNREVPRNYVLWLEHRLERLEALLGEHGIQTPSSTSVAISDRGAAGGTPRASHASPQVDGNPSKSAREGQENLPLGRLDGTQLKRPRRFTGPDNRVSTSAISFASVVQEAVRRHIAPNHRPAGLATPDHGQDSSAPQDTFFGLHSSSSIRPAPFPSEAQTRELVGVYLEYANPQLPVLHRPEFEAFLSRVYEEKAHDRSPRSLFLVNIVCAIGAGTSAVRESGNSGVESTEQFEPEQYYAAAMQSVPYFLTAPKAIQSTPGGLEELQAVLLIANFALLRPVAPGLWYIAGVAMRQAKNLGLYQEGAEDIDLNKSDAGVKVWSREMRRRLWWCTYSIDRLVSVCVGRPTSIDETLITTPFPSMLDDRYISPAGFRTPSVVLGASPPSSKLVAFHYFRLRLLHSEILQVLEARRAQIIRGTGGGHLHNQYLPGDLKEHFLERFNGDFRRWRADIDRRLWTWRHEIPAQEETGVSFEPLYLELNFWQTRVMLYRHSLSVPAQLRGELDESTLEESKITSVADAESIEDEQDVFYKAGVAGQAVIDIYRQLHKKNLVNYTYLATHHLFICGVSFLYAIWQSPRVRQKISHEDIEHTVAAAATVLTGLCSKCPPAENARDAFKRMSKVTLKFYSAAMPDRDRRTTDMSPMPIPRLASSGSRRVSKATRRGPRHMPQFDTSFRQLFSDQNASAADPKQGRPVSAEAVPDDASAAAEQVEGDGRGRGHAGNDMTLDPQLQASPSISHTISPLSDPHFTDGSQVYMDDPQPMDGFFDEGPVTFDDAFWESLTAHDPSLFGALPGGDGVDVLGTAGLGFELGFGASTVDVDVTTAPVAVDSHAGAQQQRQQQQQQQQLQPQLQQQQWREKNFDLLDGWLVNGRMSGF